MSLKRRQKRLRSTVLRAIPIKDPANDVILVTAKAHHLPILSVTGEEVGLSLFGCRGPHCVLCEYAHLITGVSDNRLAA